MHTGRIVMDTSAYSRFRSGHEEVLDYLATADVVHVPTIVLGELHAGFLVGQRRRENEVALRAFLAEPFVDVRPVDGEVSRRYGEIFAALRRAGTPIPTNDVWIAAVTQVAGAHLLTFDADFAHVPGLAHTVLT